MSEHLTLKHPFTTASGKVISELTLRRPKVRDLKAAQNYGASEAAQEIGLLAIVTGLTAEDVEEMDLADYGQLQARFRALVGSDGGAVADAGAAGPVVPVSAQ